MLVRLLLLLPLLLASALHASEIVKSPNDPREYALFTLDNGLKALVISDPAADKAAAALNVDVGSMHDPQERPGLAHFLEHMLFLGTEKYPEAGEYQSYISQHGGMHNAYTAPERTNYFFDVDSAFLKPALDRFAQFFVAPLFTAEYVQRERQAVNSEYQSKLKEDGRRIYTALKQAYNPEHPLARFAVGSLETLADREESQVRDDLLAFYERYYSANLMSLVVLGREPTEQLQALVTDLFSGVPNRQVQVPAIDVPLFRPASLPARLEVQSLKDLRELSLTFPLPPVRPHYASKPLRYLSALLGHEGQGSLLAVLKQRGWAESLSAGPGINQEDTATLSVQIGLTEAGLGHTDAILALVFQYLRLIDQAGIAERFYTEERLLGEMSFRFDEPGNPVYEVSRLANHLREYPAEQLLSAPYLYQRFEPELIRSYLSRLTPENVLVTLVSDSASTDQVAPWFDTPYRLSPITPAERENWQVAKPDPALALPPENPFLADDFSIKPADNPAPRPELLVEEAGLRLWHQQDTEFDTPRADLFFSFRSPVAHSSPRHALMTELYLNLVNDRLNPIAYPAYVAGLKSTLYPHMRGYTLRLSGFSQKQPLLLEEILKVLTSLEVKPERLAIYRDEMRQGLENALKERPSTRTMHRIYQRLLVPRWSEEEKLAELDSISADELQQFIKQLYREGEIVALAHGNLTREDAAQVASLLRTRVLADVKAAPVASGTVRQLPEARTEEVLKLTHNDSAISVYLQGDDKGFAQRARYGLLGQVLSAPFFHELRTEKQLGYLVYASAMPILEHPGLVMVVQSPSATGPQLEGHIEQFLQRVPDLVSNLSPKDLERHRQSLVLKLLEKEKRLSERSSRYWEEIDREHYGFDSREQLAEQVSAVSREQLAKLSGELRQRTLVIHSTGDALQAQSRQPTADEPASALAQ